MEILDYLRALRRGWKWLLLAVVLSTGAAAYVTSRQTPLYATEVKFFVSGQPADDANTALTGGYLSQQRIVSYANLVASRPVVDRALTVAKLERDGVHPVVVAQQVSGTVLMTLSVTDTSPERAVEVARAFGRVFPSLVEQVEAPKSGGASPVRATVVEPPAVPTAPISPNPERNLLFGFALGLLLGSGAAVTAGVLDTSLKDRDEVERLDPQVAMLGVVPFEPKGPRLIADDTVRSARAEAFRQIRTNVQFAGIDESLRSLVVTSPMPSEGKSTVTANLGITLAQAGLRVLVVDADMRRPSLSAYFGVDGSTGLTNLLLGAASLKSVVQPWRNLLHVLPSGPLPPNPADVLGSYAMVELVKFLEDRYDIVLFDSPPTVPMTDAAVLAAHTSGAIVVVRVGETTKDQLRRAYETLRRVGAPIVGTVANGVAPVKGKSYTNALAYNDALMSSVAFPRERLKTARRTREAPHQSVEIGEALVASARMSRWQDGEWATEEYDDASAYAPDLAGWAPEPADPYA